MSSLRAALSEPPIRRVQTAWAGCISAEAAVSVGLALAAYRASGVLGVGAIALARSMPAAVLGPFAAVLVDLRSRASILRVVLIARTAAVAGMAIVVAAGMSGPLYVLAAADALVYTMWWPAHAALLAQLVTDPARLTAANVATTTIENVGLAAGPALAGGLVAAHALTMVFVVAATLLLTSLVPLRRVPAVATARSRPATHRADLLGGFVALRELPHPRTVVAVYLAQTLCLGAVGTLVVVVATRLVGLGASGVGWLNAVIGVGGAIGALLTLRLVGRGRLGWLLARTLVLWGVALATIAAIPTVVSAIAALAVLGIANALVDVIALTLLQRLVDDDVLGRVLGVFEGLWWAMLGIGAMGGALLVRATGPRTAVTVVAAALPLTAVVCVRLLRRIDLVATSPAAAQLLASVRMFAPLGVARLERLGQSARTLTVPDGSTIVRRGEPGDEVFVIAAGDVVVDAAVGPVTLGVGDTFGEIAPLRTIPRTATVTATSDVTLLTIPSASFLTAISSAPTARAAAHALAAARTREGGE